MLQAVVTAVVVFITVVLIHRGLFTLGQFMICCAVLLVIGLVLGQVFGVRWLARRGPKQPWIHSAGTWESPLSPAHALKRIRAALEDLHPAIEGNVTCLRVAVGSDVTFRRRGMGSEVGWQALPLLATFRVTPREAGCRIEAEARDNLGWYPAPPIQLILDELEKRSASMIERAVRATQC